MKLYLIRNINFRNGIPTNTIIYPSVRFIVVIDGKNLIYSFVLKDYLFSQKYKKILYKDIYSLKRI